MQKEDFISRIVNKAKPFDLFLSENDSQTSISFWSENRMYAMNVDCSNDKRFYVYLSIRAGIGNNDPSDCIELFSCFFALMLYKLNFCSSAINMIPHPVCENELRGAVISFHQNNLSFGSYNEESLDKIEKLFFLTTAIDIQLPEFMGCKSCICSISKRNEKVSKRKLDHWITCLSKAFKKEPEELIYNVTVRNCPPWSHFWNSNMSIFKTENCTSFLNKLNFDIQKDELDGPTGKLILYGNIKSYIHYDYIAFFEEIFSLFEPKFENLTFYPLENLLLAVGKKHLLITNAECGLVNFQKEKELLQERHQKELSLLFSNNKYVWAETIDGDLFEDLCYDLLRKESNINWVRKAGKGTAADKGKDLLIQKLVPKPSGGLKIQMDSLKILVQCKAYNRSVNKGHVRDIRDTIDEHEADGYLLIVSSQLSTPLFDHLNIMRNQGIYDVDWWSKHEIEEKLDKYPEILQKYHQIVRIEKS